MLVVAGYKFKGLLWGCQEIF